MVKHFTIYDQGSSPYQEDGLVITQRTFGVVDGVSAPYSPKCPPKMFDGLSGGEFVARQCEEWFHQRDSIFRHTHTSLRRNIKGISIQIAARHDLSEYDLVEDTGSLAGTTFAFARMATSGDEIEVAQAGDCMVVVELRNGDIIVSPNQVRAHDREMHEHIERIQHEVAQEMFGLVLKDIPEDKQGQVRGEMWNRFHPILLEARRRNVNRRESPNGYGLLNGQLALLDNWWELMWERTFPCDEIATLLLFSDGMVPWSIMQLGDDEVGRSVLEEFKRRRLAGLLLTTRSIEKQAADTNYINQAEATAVALVF